MGLFEQFTYTNFHELNLDSLAKLVGEVKTNIDGILDEAKAYTDLIKAEVDAEMRLQTQEVQNMLDQARNDFDHYFDLFMSELQDVLVTSESYTDQQVGLLRNYVDQQLVIVGQDVIDPVTGLIGPVQNAIYSLYGLHTNDTLTASEYDGLVSGDPMTATAYDAKNLTATAYDLSGKSLLP